MDDTFKSKSFVPKGFLHPLLLMLLNKKPMNGYELRAQIRKHTGFWQPSAGSIYPALGHLRKNGYIRIQKKTGKSTTYAITDKGKSVAVKFEQTKREMRDKFAEIFSEIFHTDRKHINAMFDQIKENYTKQGGKYAPLLDSFAETRELVFETMKTPLMAGHAKTILTDTNSKLKKLVK